MTRGDMLLKMLNAAAAIPMLALLIYAGLNGSGHTGFHVLILVPLYMIHFGYNVFGLLLRSRTGTFHLGVIIDCFGLLLPLLLHFLRILMQYDSWTNAGMPEPPAWRIAFLAAYGVFFAAAVIIRVKHRGKGQYEIA